MKVVYLPKQLNQKNTSIAWSTTVVILRECFQGMLKTTFRTHRKHFDLLEQRQYKNDSTEFRCMLILNLPPCFPHRIAEWKSAPNSKQAFIWSPSIRSYIILALDLHWFFICFYSKIYPTIYRWQRSFKMAPNENISLLSKAYLR